MAITSPNIKPVVPQEEGAPLGVVVVDPLPIVTEGLGLFLETQSNIEVIATANTADDALQHLSRVRHRGHSAVGALVAMELTGEHDAMWLIRTVRERHPTFLVIACGVNPSRLTVSRALFTGADGFINKRADPAEFVHGLQRAINGEMVLVGLPANWLGEIAEDVQKEQNTHPVLSEREREVLSLAAGGLSARGIAERLTLSERTVTTHFTNIYDKLGVHSRVAAITAAVRDGLITVTEEA